jgi:hypothetical protein
MAVQPLAGVAVESDKMGGAKDQTVFLDADMVAFGHETLAVARRGRKTTL